MDVASSGSTCSIRRTCDSRRHQQRRSSLLTKSRRFAVENMKGLTNEHQYIVAEVGEGIADVVTALIIVGVSSGVVVLQATELSLYEEKMQPIRSRRMP